MARSETEWEKPPSLPETHYVDPRIYSDEEIFREEQEKIFRRVWLIACHESEVPEGYDYRTFSHPAGVNLVVVRDDDGTIRTFFNVCPHRGNTLVYTPSNNGKHLMCIFHSWAFDCTGQCVSIPRPKAYGDRVRKESLGLREVRTEVGYGGFVWVNLDDHAERLSEFIDPALTDMLPALDTEPLDVFTYHCNTVDTNWKFWRETNSEFYHDYLHYHNRKTSMQQAGYWEREYSVFPNGHVRVGDHF